MAPPCPRAHLSRRPHPFRRHRPGSSFPPAAVERHPPGAARARCGPHHAQHGGGGGALRPVSWLRWAGGARAGVVSTDPSYSAHCAGPAARRLPRSPALAGLSPAPPRCPSPTPSRLASQPGHLCGRPAAVRGQPSRFDFPLRRLPLPLHHHAPRAGAELGRDGGVGCTPPRRGVWWAGGRGAAAEEGCPEGEEEEECGGQAG